MAFATTVTTSKSSPTKATSVTPSAALAASTRARVERIYTIFAKPKGYVLGTGRTKEGENEERDMGFGGIVQQLTNIYHSGGSQCSK